MYNAQHVNVAYIPATDSCVGLTKFFIFVFFMAVIFRIFTAYKTQYKFYCRLNPKEPLWTLCITQGEQEISS